jgi:hypothetical protein
MMADNVDFAGDKLAQILGYLTTDEVERFQAYAAELRLDATALANLLIVRELRSPRLRELRDIYDRDLGGVERSKVVAHQHGERTKLAFKEHAEGLGLKASRAAAILFRAELDELWLQRSMDR